MPLKTKQGQLAVSEPGQQKSQISNTKVRLWQWPNAWALDAMLIAVSWQAVFAITAGQELSSAARWTLGLSVWLTYTADHLLDVSGRSINELHSVRHRLAKHYSGTLRKLWGCVLAVNLGIALTGLTGPQLRNGAALLLFCLLYTFLNQALSRRFFPKELCVALIYTAGVVIFLHPAPGLLPETSALGLLCLTNCLIISTKEQPIDAAMQVRSIAQYLPKLPYSLYAGCLILLMVSQQLHLPLALSLAALMGVHLARQRLSVESFRVLADTALLIGPLVTLTAACL